MKARTSLIGAAATSRSSSRWAPCSRRPPASIPRNGREAALRTARCAQSSTGTLPSSCTTRQQSLSAASPHMAEIVSSAQWASRSTRTHPGGQPCPPSDVSRLRFRFRNAADEVADCASVATDDDIRQIAQPHRLEQQGERKAHGAASGRTPSLPVPKLGAVALPGRPRRGVVCVPCAGEDTFSPKHYGFTI
eukprot:scaffold3808_cov112-Isochrysis_galbana.AAC.17